MEGLVEGEASIFDEEEFDVREKAKERSEGGELKKEGKQGGKRREGKGGMR